MIFNALISAVKTQSLIDKKSNERVARRKYISEKFNERSIINRYFK
jgi:hypothetical protein